MEAPVSAQQVASWSSFKPLFSVRRNYCGTFHNYYLRFVCLWLLTVSLQHSTTKNTEHREVPCILYQ